MKKKRQWSFAQSVKDAREALAANRALDCQLETYASWVQEALDIKPFQFGSYLESSVGVSRWCEALLQADAGDPGAWKRVHLVWRYRAFHQVVFLQRLIELAAEFPDRVATGKLGIALIDSYFINDLLMTAAFSGSLGEDEAARWLGDRVAKLILDRSPIVKPDALTDGFVEPYLFRLYLLWRAPEFDPNKIRIADHGPYQTVFDNWENSVGMEEATLQLCELHAKKIINRNREDSDGVTGLITGPYTEFPAEIVFLQRVRRDLGLSVPDPDHALLRSPLMKIPIPCPRSGIDPSLRDAYSRCKQMMPNLNIPWEEAILAAGTPFE